MSSGSDRQTAKHYRTQTGVIREIPSAVAVQMRRLERTDREDTTRDVPFAERLRQIPRETGRFLAIVAGGAPAGHWVEVGTSGGYSALWLGMACLQRGAQLTTIENDAAKLARANETVRAAELTSCVEVRAGDAREVVGSIRPISLIFIDCISEAYCEVLDAALPNMPPGAILLADNATSHSDELEDFVRRLADDDEIDWVVVPVGKGVFYGRKRFA